jgi:HEAT repeat protein
MIILAGFAHVDTAQAALQRYAKSDDQQTRKLVAESLRMACQGKRAEAPRAILEPMLRNDPSWEVRAAAATALGDIRCPSALPALLDVLDHCSIESRENRTSVLKFVVGAIYFIPSDSAIEPLVRVLEDSPHPDLRRNTLLTLNKITGQHYATPAEWRAWLRRRADPSQ